MRTGRNEHTAPQASLWHRILNWLGKRPVLVSGEETFPDYFTCPYCSEPEVEAWNCEKVRCHNCGRTFTCDQARSAYKESP
jgi:hypothetical protein